MNVKVWVNYVKNIFCPNLLKCLFLAKNAVSYNFYYYCQSLLKDGFDQTVPSRFGKKKRKSPILLGKEMIFLYMKALINTHTNRNGNNNANDSNSMNDESI